MTMIFFDPYVDWTKKFDRRWRMAPLLFFIFFPFLFFSSSAPLFSQDDQNAETPTIAKKLEGEEERKKLLRAVDILDQLEQNVEANSFNIQAIKEEIRKLKEQVNSLEKDIEKIKIATSKERLSPSNPKKGNAAVSEKAHRGATTQLVEKGYYYVVKKNDTLESIADAYRKSGVNVTAEDIRKSNNLSSHSPLEVGSKLFIPKKETKPVQSAPPPSPIPKEGTTIE
ncbi:peptidoglycan-binding protein LysM [Candidatus Methylacidiphilum fumarolicum]|nr:LysM peptidoglycan-binding domain-containing protein [Candidatus Methylacidiphilum fumarolicum]MBW6415882.1 LysM peptidoglycan-binding domain-containing protein [Candidatus Methylacidiphilum fumarolicum]TFE71422.1 peptidoglycan-binding protein LysM [Candidatus Methylacidiphilum fumarolicum]TFE74733.1 peptidoglycan-binding protein LysM [Candidatus Methylacidiphilum fumarolicum]CAI9086320.1 LysM domain containing protein (Modular protein) [Candidatus Methylacidiphilum fumarolicum]